VVVVVRWAQGADVVLRLIEQRHLQRVTTDVDTVQALLAAAQRHLDLARSGADIDREGAYSLAYDAARKSATAVLGHQGLRPTSAGGHITVVDAMSAQFPGVPGLTSLDRLRRRRNQTEYPEPRSYDPVTATEVTDAIRVASDCLATAQRLLTMDKLGIF
jgi:hypothetical protein